jgi:carbamate kinase
MKPIAVIAIGGNSLTLPGERGTFRQQQAHARATCEGVAAALQRGYRVVLTHGNGPQVGDALLRSELTQDALPPLQLDVCDSETQGSIGYLLQQTLGNVLAEKGLRQTVVSLVTQVVVDERDPAFAHPSKPIGPFYSRGEAEERKAKLGWAILEDAGRGWRRVVASPRPMEIVELNAIRACLDAGVVVIAAGGGGIPVVRRNGGFEGIEAVVDKDRASALLAADLEAELLLFSTAVPHVSWHFRQADERPLAWLNWEKAWEYLQAGEFPAGSMGPKIEAALAFLESGGELALITCPEQIAAALDGEAGTGILPRAGVAREPVSAT